MERDHISAGRPRERLPLNVWPDQVTVAVDDQRGAAHPRAGSSEPLLTGNSDPEDGVEDRLRRCLERPADAIFDLLGRMRLVEATSEEELQEAQVIMLQQAGSVHPVRIGLERVLER